MNFKDHFSGHAAEYAQFRPDYPPQLFECLASIALHWFDLPRFFAEASRVLKANGFIAAWAYLLFETTPEIDKMIQHFYGKRPVHSCRRSAAWWNLEQLLGYLRTWSATKKFIAKRGFDPIDQLANELRPFWSEPEMEMNWPLHLRVGIANKP